MEKDMKTSTRQKLSTLWTALMFFYIYADIKCFYETGLIEKIMAGNIDGLIINDTFLFWGAILMTIPVLMVFLPMVLPYKACRVVNIVVAALHIPLAVMVLFVGTETWSYWYFYTFMEILTLITIILFSVKWKISKSA